MLRRLLSVTTLLLIFLASTVAMAQDAMPPATLSQRAASALTQLPGASAYIEYDGTTNVAVVTRDGGSFAVVLGRLGDDKKGQELLAVLKDYNFYIVATPTVDPAVKLLERPLSRFSDPWCGDGVHTGDCSLTTIMLNFDKKVE